MYRLLVENVTDYAIVMLSPTGEVASWSEGAERILGYTEAQILGRHFSVLSPRDEVEEGKPDFALRAAIRDGRWEDVSWRVRGDGSRLWGSVVLTAVVDEAGRLVGVGQIIRDLTERREVAQQYEESRQRYRSLFEYNPDAICSFDLEGTLRSANPAAEALCGCPAEELVGTRFAELFAPEDAERAGGHFRRAAAGEPQQLEMGVAHRGGHRVEARLTVFPIVVHGEILGVYAIAEDITGRKRAEAEREVLLARERVARETAEAASRAKSSFLSVMSHELKTPLNVITGYADILYDREAGPLTPAQERHLGRIRDTTRQLRGMIDQVLSFARVEWGRQETQAETVDLAALIRDAATTVEPLAQERGLAFRLECPDETWVRETDPTLARQVLFNLLSNACKFTERGEVCLLTERDGDGVVTVRVCDTGIGIRPEHLERIWEPFWQAEESLTRRNEGAGLGLGITRHLVALLGWEIRVESTHGEGSTFTLRVPPPAPRRPAGA